MSLAFSSLDELVSRLLAAAGMALAPPVDLAMLAAYLGVHHIVDDASMVEDGRVEVRRGQITIVLRIDRAPARRRFTLAHELGHMILAQPDLQLGPLRRRERLFDDEAFCDRVAEALLLPAAWIDDRYGGQAQTLDNLRRCALSCQVSLAATSIRLTRVAGWRRLLVRWRKRGRAWRVDGVSGYTHPALRGESLQSVPATTALFEEILSSERRDRCAWVPLSVAGRPCAIEGELSPSRSVVMALLNPTTQRSLPGSTSVEDVPSELRQSKANADLTFLTVYQPAGVL